MSSGTVAIELMLGNGFIVLAFEENLLSILFIISSSFGQPFHKDIALLILLDVELISIVLVQQINQCFVV